jgi:hypothetical protein
MHQGVQNFFCASLFFKNLIYFGGRSRIPVASSVTAIEVWILACILLGRFIYMPSLGVVTVKEAQTPYSPRPFFLQEKYYHGISVKYIEKKRILQYQHGQAMAYLHESPLNTICST